MAVVTRNLTIQIGPRVLLAISLSLWSASILSAQSPQSAASNQDSLQKPENSYGNLLKRYCIACHSERLKTAGMVLENQKLDRLGEDPVRWEKVLRKLRSNEMPPAQMPQPSTSDRNAFAGYLETGLDRAAALHPNPGRPTAHRLNRVEYANAIRDLFGLDVATDALPRDDTGYGFDNIADVLSMSPMLVERYMASARKIARLAIGDTHLTPVADTFDGLAEVRASRGGRTGRNEQFSEDLPFDSSRGLSLRYTFPVDAEYLFNIKLSGGGGAFGETTPPIGEILDVRVPVKAGVRSVGLTFRRSDAIPETAGDRGGGVGSSAAPGTGPKILELRLDGALLKRYDAKIPAPEGKEINQLAIAGPYNITGPGDTPSRRRIVICKPAGAAEEEPCAGKIFRSVGRLAYRRPLTQADLQPLLALYREERGKGGVESGIESGLRGILVSPTFLFRIEADPPGAGIHRISGFDLASRLSFFLWSSIPDEELLNLAEQGKLTDAVVLQQQVTRMLNDPKSDAFVDNFTGQWLMLRNLEQLKPDPLAFPAYDYSLRRAFRQETKLFFNAILRENRPVTDLLDANFTFVNQRLAEFYGVPGIYGPRFRRIEIQDPRRSGLLGQGSILTVTSYPNRTSVVQRGKWVLDSLLASPPPPPPPDVPPLQLQNNERQLSVREAMEAHRANPVCAACHARMDPIGFALENYDGIGGWRDQDGDVPIDPSGKLPDGTEFRGADGLKKLLLTRYRDQFLHAFLEKLMTYALGRGMEAYDQPTMRKILRESAKENSTISSMIRHIVESDAFLMRRSGDL